MHGVGLDKVLVRNILEHAVQYTWKIQQIGLLMLRLDEQREFALHVWAPERCTGVPPIHDHPYDFVSRIIAGELTNARYVEDPSGVKYLRERYKPSNEESRTMDYVQLVPEVVETFKEGDEYAQAADEFAAKGKASASALARRPTIRVAEPSSVTAAVL